jgi:hypothetical protein
MSHGKTAGNYHYSQDLNNAGAKAPDPELSKTHTTRSTEQEWSDAPFDL